MFNGYKVDYESMEELFSVSDPRSAKAKDVTDGTSGSPGPEAANGEKKKKEEVRDQTARHGLWVSEIIINKT